MTSFLPHLVNTYFQASRSEAPLIVCAPHATILDALPIFVSDSVPVAKDIIKKYFMIGNIGRFQQVCQSLDKILNQSIHF